MCRTRTVFGRRAKGASGAAATWPGLLRPRPLQLGAVIHSLLCPGAPFPARRRDKRLGVQRLRTREPENSFCVPATSAHTMADSERLSAPGCWLACTSFSRTKKGLFLFAEIVSASGPEGGQRPGVQAGPLGTGLYGLRQARGQAGWQWGCRWVSSSRRIEARVRGSVEHGRSRELVVHW